MFPDAVTATTMNRSMLEKCQMQKYQANVRIFVIWLFSDFGINTIKMFDSQAAMGTNCIGQM